MSYRRIGMGNQSVEGELLIKDCHYIKNPDLIDDDQDSDDFEDDDDDNER